MRRWGQGDFKRIAPATRIYRSDEGLDPWQGMALHTVTVCDLAKRDLDCESTAVLGPTGRVFYVSPPLVFVWNVKAAVFPHPARRRRAGRRAQGRRQPGRPVLVPRGRRRRSSTCWCARMAAEKRCGRASIVMAERLRCCACTSAASPTDVMLLLRKLSTASWARRMGAALSVNTCSMAASASACSPRATRTAQPSDFPSIMQWIASKPWARMQWRSAAMDATCTSAACASRPTRRSPGATRQRQPGRVAQPRLLLQRAPGAARAADHRRPAAHHATQAAAILGLRPLSQEPIVELLRDRHARRPGGFGSRRRLPRSCVDWYGNSRPLFIRDRIFALMGYEIVEGASSATASSRRGASTSPRLRISSRTGLR